jgi:hypothetical protein
LSANAHRATPITLGSLSLGRTLCRDHHLKLHHYGNEAGWWADLKIVPMQVAKDLWAATLRQARFSFSESEAKIADGDSGRANEKPLHLARFLAQVLVAGMAPSN